MNNFGLKFPLLYNNASSLEQIDNIRDYFRFCLKLLFLTAPGEKLNDLYYGIGLGGFLFKNPRENNLESIRGKIKYQVSRSMPMIRIKDVIITEDGENDHSLYAKIFYSVPDFNIEDDFEISI